MTYGRCCLQSVDTESRFSQKPGEGFFSSKHTVAVICLYCETAGLSLSTHLNILVPDISDFAHCSLRRRELLMISDLKF